MADVVEPAPCARVARRGQQLDGLEAFVAQEAPQVGVAAVQGSVKALEAARRGHHQVAVVPREPELVEPGGERGDRDRRAARRERQRTGAGTLGQPAGAKALAEQRAAQAVAVQQRQRGPRLVEQQPQLVAEPVAA